MKIKLLNLPSYISDANIIQDNLPQIKQLMREHNVAHAYAFGSAATGSMHKDSDIDFVITFTEGLDYRHMAIIILICYTLYKISRNAKLTW